MEFKEILVPSNSQLRRMSEEEHQLLCDGLAAMKIHLQLQLQGKLDWRLRLPWLLIGTAHTDEGIARQCARKALAAFDQDGRQEVHHRISWSWCQPASPQRCDLQRIIDGAARESLSPRFLAMLATMRFIPIVESCIESRHARVSLESVVGLGPVRVSLSNRLPLIEARIASDPNFLSELAACCEEARDFKHVPTAMGFEEHPLLQTSRLKAPSDWVPVLTQIIYRCALDDLFDDKSMDVRYHTLSKNRVAYTSAKRVREAAPAVARVQDAGVLRQAMVEHLKETADAGAWYSVPGHALQLERLFEYFAEAETVAAAKRRRLVHQVGDDFGLSLDHEAAGEDKGSSYSDLCYFRIRSSAAGDKKHQRPAAGAGGVLLSSQFAITLHQTLPGFEDVPAVESEPMRWSTGNFSDVIALVTDIADPSTLESSLLKWEAAHGLLYTVRSLPDSTGEVDFDFKVEASKALTTLVEKGAFAGSDAACHFGMEPDVELLLLGLGLVQPVVPSASAGQGWQLTEQAMERLVYGRALFNERAVFIDRGLPVREMTAYELLASLRKKGWAWRLWVPPSQRKRATAAVVQGYRPGDAKLYFTSSTAACEEYFRALHEAGRMVANGLDMVRHGQGPSYYERLLAGDFSPPLRGRRRHYARGALKEDVEPGEPRERARPLQRPRRGRAGRGDGARIAAVDVRSQARRLHTTRINFGLPIRTLLIYLNFCGRKGG